MRLLLVVVVLAMIESIAIAKRDPSVAFFYGKPLPIAELARFEWIVVEPDNVDARALEDLQRAGGQVFGYVSLGEASPTNVHASWKLGANSSWGTAILDPRSSGWRARVLARVDALHARGYRGLFLDTLDSYAMVLHGKDRRAAQIAMASLVRAIAERHRDMKLFFNRGFELFDDVGGLAAAVAAESLVFGWDPANKQYVDVPDADRTWLADKLRAIQTKHGIPAVVVDYLPESRRAEAVAAASRIQGMGFVPWIATPALDVIGVGSVAAPTERVVLAHDGAEGNSVAMDMIVQRLRALGCVVDTIDIRKRLPESSARAIATWFTDDDLPEALGYPRWLEQQIDRGARVAMFGRPGFVPSKSLVKKLGLEAGPTTSARTVRIVHRDAALAGEVEPALRSRGVLRWRAVGRELSVHLRIEDANGTTIDPVVTAPWGGLALSPYLIEHGYEGHARWIIDPTAFLVRAFGIDPRTCAPATTGGRN